MTPEGPRPDSSKVVPLRKTPIDGAPHYSYAVVDGEITVWKTEKPTEDDADTGSGRGRAVVAAVVPAAITRYWSAEGLVYLLPRDGVDPYHSTAIDLAEGKTWQRIGIRVPRAHREAVAFAVVQVEERRGEPTSQSPSITQGIPPLAPPLGPRAHVDADTGVQTWAWLGDRLEPLGRLTVGAALAAPWVEEAGAASALWSLVGEGGAGKTMLLRLCGSIYGDRRRWCRPFDTTARGLTALAQHMSYYPLMLDEAQTCTAAPTATFTPLIMGGSRTRATRSGALADEMGRWHSLAFITTNTPMVDELTHEMWDRRLVELDATHLWQPRPADDTAHNAWWRDVARSLDLAQGWAWQALTEQYPAGPQAADFIDRAHTIPLPGRGTIGQVMQLAIAGCRWLAEWTGNDGWAEGVDDVAQAICLDREEQKTDPARDAARDIILHRAQQPGLWTSTERETVAYNGIHEGSCGLDHEGPCEWVGIVSSAWRQITTIPTARLRRTRFVDALAVGDGKNLARKVRVPDTFSQVGRIRAYVACWRALEVLAWDDQAPNGCPEQQPITLPSTPTAPPPTPLQKRSGTTPAPEASAQADAPIDRRYGAIPEMIDGTPVPIGPALREAAGTYDEVTIPSAWKMADLNAAGWEASGWEAERGLRTENSTTLNGANGATIVVRPVIKPERYCDGLADFHAMTGEPLGTSPQSFAIRTLRRVGAKTRREPRWQLPDEVNFPAPDQIAMPASWGTKQPGDQSFDRVKSHLSAITQATVAPLWYGENFAHYEADTLPSNRARFAGLWKITVPEWDPRLPSPVGTRGTVGEEIWVSTDLMKLYQHCGHSPVVHEAWLAPAHKIQAFQAWTGEVRGWAEQDRPGGSIAKRLYQGLSGRLTAPWAKGRQLDIYRPDWGYAIRDVAWCNTIRYAYELAEYHGIYPTAVVTDAIRYPADVTVPVCSPAQIKDRTPGMLPLGTQLGYFAPES